MITPFGLWSSAKDVLEHCNRFHIQHLDTDEEVLAIVTR